MLGMDDTPLVGFGNSILDGKFVEGKKVKWGKEVSLGKPAANGWWVMFRVLELPLDQRRRRGDWIPQRLRPFGKLILGST